MKALKKPIIAQTSIAILAMTVAKGGELLTGVTSSGDFANGPTINESPQRDQSPAWNQQGDDLEESVSLKQAGLRLSPTLHLEEEPRLLINNPKVWYDKDKGLRLKSESPHADLWIGARFQWRTDTLPGNINSVGSLAGPSGGDGDLSIRRGRVKGGGTLFSKKFKIYSEYNFPSRALLDYRATYKFSDSISVRFGQWKSDFSRERTDSSGKQQFVDRSLANYWFTIDRQLGTSIYLRLGQEKAYDSSIWLQYLSGRGRGAGYENGSGLWMARWQWNPQGKEMAFSQGDLNRTEDFTSAVAFAAIVGDTPFTRFSGSGGGQLPGYSFGDYRIRQALFETAARWRGWSWQHELHVKEIEDQATGNTQTLVGGYAQIGTFPSEYISWAPEPFEVVMRYAHITPDTSLSEHTQRSLSFGANWYFDGHRNKLNADVALIDIDDATGSDSEVQVRVQWERSF